MLRSSGINFMKFGFRLALEQSLDSKLRVATPRLLSDIKITKAKKKPSIATSKPGLQHRGLHLNGKPTYLNAPTLRTSALVPRC